MVTVLPYDVATARVYGQIRAQLEDEGQMLAEADSILAGSQGSEDSQADR